MAFTPRFTDEDEARWLTWTTLFGLALAVMLAQLGGLPFDLPMPTYEFGIVTPTCGLTRGSTAIARNDLALAWRYNPASFVVMGVGLVGFGRTAIGLVSGRWLDIRVPHSRAFWLAVAALTIVLWFYQQRNAEFVINSRL